MCFVCLAQAQEILNRVETAALHVGLHTNAKKTKFMSFNQQTVTKIQTQEPSLLEEVQDFKYLGAWVKSTEQDVKSRKAMTWKACNNLSKIWKSNLSKNIKIKLFQATVESVLLYGSETWTVTKKICKALDGCYTRMLRAALDISWKSHIRNREFYGDLPKITAKISNRRLQFAGHCKRRKGSVVSNLITWQPTHGKRAAGRPTKTYVDQLQADTGYTTGEIESCMENRNLWRAIIGVRQMTPEWVSECCLMATFPLAIWWWYC